MSADAGALLTRVNGVLSVLVTPERQQRLLDQVLLPLLADERGARPAVPPRRRAWVRGRAERLVEELSRAGYPVHGELASLLPRSEDEPAATTAAGVLDVALRALLRTRTAGPTNDQTRHEATGATGARPRRGHPMSERVLLHVGTPKTGTSYLQDVLFRNRTHPRRAPGSSTPRTASTRTSSPRST